MSERELAIKLVNETPDDKIGYIIAYIEGLNAEEKEDDRFCEKLVEEYKNSSDKGDFVSLEEAAKICGVDLNEVQRNSLPMNKVRSFLI